jgi:uncharacterized protein YhbP (UPF0306 family)
MVICFPDLSMYDKVFQMSSFSWKEIKQWPFWALRLDSVDMVQNKIYKKLRL